MGLLAVIKSFARTTRNGSKISDVQVDTGGGNVITAEHMSPPGDDAFPLDTDYALVSSIDRTGGGVISGYADLINDPAAEQGDKRIYGRDPSSGLVVNQVWLKSDGSVLVSNDNGSVLLRTDGGSIITTPSSTFDVAADGSITGDNGAGSFELQAGGDFVVNGATIDTGGNISTPASVAAPSILAATKELAGHVHLAGTPPGNTGPNT